MSKLKIMALVAALFAVPTLAWAGNCQCEKCACEKCECKLDKDGKCDCKDGKCKTCHDTCGCSKKK